MNTGVGAVNKISFISNLKKKKEKKAGVESGLHR